MNKQKSITSFFKRKEPENDTTPDENNPVNEDTPTRTHNHEEGPSIIDNDNVDINSLERDPGLRPPIWAYPIGKRNEIRRAYIKLGPYQPQLAEYPFSGPTKHRRRFQSTWFVKFPDWLEYSPSKDDAFCLPCYLFTETPNSRQNRLRLKASINVLLLLTTQSCPLRGHNETNNSENQGNYLEFRKVLAAYNKDVSKAIRQAPYNAKYTAPSIQKEILHIISNKVPNYIRQEIGNSKFCIIVDEARDESKREKMVLVLRFVDKYGTIRERFFYLIRVSDTTAATLKRELCSVLARHNLSVENIRGQGYDGASNMRGEWNGYQALFLSNCPYSYYIHCFAHRLQLALVAASRDVRVIHQFFSNLTFIINVIVSSLKRVDQLQSIKSDEIKRLLSIGEIDSGRGSNQTSTLKRVGDTRWGSHLYSIRSLMKMFDATMLVLEHISNDKYSNSSQRGDVDVALYLMISFDFVFIAHLMEEILGIANVLCQAL
ncbi:zinc finger MYM-type protein 1-like [Chenopodium quinoa]|uniref:zinc finger MYM-type protein 1-like n=1 Tax=Chenopodium quinoa TaxID=63459 RepID=UPI000B78EEFB|nr:zinc finger MYM-type protein 1-like [Chenopodium quinoa]